jgi:outer membrane autotransporter protein
MDGFVGYGAASVGMAVVRGSGSVWTNNGNVAIGEFGSGMLTIEDGGVVTSAYGYIGTFAGSSGTVTVTGQGSTWSNTTGVSVGEYGSGTLIIENGGAVTNTYGVIATIPGSSGTVTVSGNGSTWTNSSTLSVGDSGTGTLRIENGGTVSNTDAWIGWDAGVSGTATVTGPSSSWSNSGNLYVGYDGVGSLIIERGGSVSSIDGIIGSNVGSSGSTTVRGAGSSWTIVNYLEVGPYGSGSLNIEDGGRVSTDVGVIGRQAGSSGTVTVTGPGSQWTNTTALYVGNAGTGSLTIEDGGRVSNSIGVIGAVSGTSGTAVVRGAGSQWSNSGDLSIGQSGAGSLTITDGGAVSAATTRLGALASSQGLLTLTGSDGARGLLTTGQIVKGAGSATLTLDGGMLRATVDQPHFLSNFAPGDVVLNAGGAIIDSSTYSIGIAAALSGGGGLIKTGVGRLELTGTSMFSGPSSVLAGQLAINGSIANSAVTVSNGAVLSGSGTIGGMSALSGATIAPGNSIGTLSVNGNVGFAAGSTYAVEINGAGQSDRIAATGTATLSGGTVQILPDQGVSFMADHPYTILTAQGGVSGRFAESAGSAFAFITPTLRYSSDAVTLTMVRKTEPQPEPPQPDPPEPPTPPEPPQPIAFHSVAETRNQYTTADGVEALGAGNRLYDIILGASVAGARQAFDALSGEAHASAVSVAYEDSRLVREAILTRLRQPLSSGLPTFVQGSYSAAYAADRSQAPQPVTVTSSFDPRRSALWGEGFGSWGQSASNGNAASLETATGGFILGADALVSDVFRLGVAGGFTRTSFDIDGRLSSGSNDSVFGALYGASSWGNLNLRLGASYAWHDFDVSRTIRFPGFADRTHASYDGWTAQAFAEVGYRMSLGRVHLELFAGASLLRLHTDGFAEEGGAAGLTGSAQDQDLATTTLGLRAAAPLSETVPLIARGLLGWRHAFGDVEPTTLLAFAGGASAFMVAGAPIDRDALVAEAGLDWQASDAITLGVAYSGQIGERAQEHALKGNLTWRFSSY